MNGAQLDTLIGLVERGPLWDGDVPSKSGRDDLIDMGLAVRVVAKGADGYTAATYKGRDAYKSNVKTTGAWSLGRSFLRGARSITQALARALRACEIRMWSMRKPRLRRNANSR